MAKLGCVRPDRRQLRWDMVDLDGLLPADHRARLVWSFVESLDLSPLYDQVLSREGEADGRPPIRRFFFRCGSMRRLRAWGRRANWSGSRKARQPTDGWRAACR